VHVRYLGKPIGPAKTLEKAAKHALWPVHDLFCNSMSFIICKIGMWILDNGKVRYIQEDLSIVPCKGLKRGKQGHLHPL
jgi:hypothetical protein